MMLRFMWDERFWWTLRSWWHRPQMKAEAASCMLRDFPWYIVPYALYLKSGKIIKPRVARSEIRSALRQNLCWARNRFRCLFPCCSWPGLRRVRHKFGPLTHWTIDLCDWLEDTARDLEDLNGYGYVEQYYWELECTKMEQDNDH
jgi:hypothetical protein